MGRGLPHRVSAHGPVTSGWAELPFVQAALPGAAGREGGGRPCRARARPRLQPGPGPRTQPPAPPGCPDGGVGGRGARSEAGGCAAASTMGAAASRRRALRSEAMSSVAAKVRAARAFGEYLSQSHPENSNGADHLLADAYSGHDGSPEMEPAPQNKRRLSLVSNGRYEGSLSEEMGGEKPAGEGPEPCVYTISGEPALLPGPEAEAIELVVVKGRRQGGQHHHHSHPLRGSPGGGRDDLSRSCQSWASSRQGSKECPGCTPPAPSPPPRAFGLDPPPLPEPASRRKKLEGMCSVDRVSDDIPIRTWFPKENLFSFQTATTTMQAVFRGYAERKRRKRENESASVIQRNFRKHLRMVGSRRVKAQTFAERRERSFSRSWSDPTPMKADTSHDSRDSNDLQGSCCTLDEAFEGLDWEAEKSLEAVACDSEDFVPPKVMLISSKVPKAEYIPTIIRRDDPSIIPILYDHEHATFEDILEEIEKKLNVYHKGARIWKMLIFCQGGPGHLYLLKNKVATFAKVEKEDDMIQDLGWRPPVICLLITTGDLGWRPPVTCPIVTMGDLGWRPPVACPLLWARGPRGLPPRHHGDLGWRPPVTCPLITTGTWAGGPP
ncbi:NMDA receptor synaptonuclear signaling and neuronal migration factor isoform X2 [Elephas maximus indicus]|uniref:NMDA receptor synaptonuclear signaling and neuronal migration factor isoform X2 n=1 Tax=Elephas maximus indicus TaxID=99487 RepID=UPI0021160B92|nr:NMDA receptor synaptonuclear signaling and neuronal migration factor isoform X2 [Elephas maximus indicus]